jgi:murein DD-endopeptidase MepM/ murein hydrolase activator NlpD
MRARMAAAFVLGMATGALCLGVALWRSGSLVTAPPWTRTQATTVTVANLPAPATGNLSDLLAEAGKPVPQPPPVMDPLDFSESAPEEPLPGGQPVPALTPPVGPAVPAGKPPLIGPRPPIGHGEADRIAPDRTGLPHLAMPLAGIDPHKLTDTYNEIHSGLKHEAQDIMAPRGTPVLAVAQGNVAKLFTSKPGGLTVYQFDDSRTYCYYYAHLDRYAAGIQDGTLLRAGQVLGYVGSTGNASPNAPHLHFAVFKLGPEKKWWEGTPIDPLPMFK